MKIVFTYFVTWAVVSTVMVFGMKWAGVPGSAEVGHSWWYFLGGMIGGLIAFVIAEKLLEEME